MPESDDQLSKTIPMLRQEVGVARAAGMPIEFAFAGLSHLGRHRERNEDAWGAFPELGVFAVADGLGGHPAGNVASRVVVDVLPALLGPRLRDVSDLRAPEAIQAVAHGLARLSDGISREGLRSPSLSGMGTTLVVAVLRGAQALIAHIGDSRAYRLRAGRLEPLTRDHSVVQYLLDTGALTPEQVSRHPARAQVTRYMGMPGEVMADTCLLDLQLDDRLLLCTDGLTGMVSVQAISELLEARAEPAAVCRALVNAALRAGGRDNITVLVVHCRARQASLAAG